MTKRTINSTGAQSEGDSLGEEIRRVIETASRHEWLIMMAAPDGESDDMWERVLMRIKQ